MIMNFPDTIIDLPVLKEGDESDLKDFGIPKGVDIVTVSFVRKASDLEHVRDVLGPKGAHIKIFSNECPIIQGEIEIDKHYKMEQ